MIFPLIGNETVKNAVLNAITSKRIPHAIIIEGESGLGKSALSRFIAKSVLCSNNGGHCDNCKSCHLVDVGSHPDLHTVSPEAKKKNIAVDQIREMRLQAFTKPQMSEACVFIIDRAETLNQQSQNTLLKVLEEPPGNVVFIFLCNNTASLLDTVISRCIIYSLSSVPIKVAAQYLQEQHGFDGEAALKAAESSNGNIGRAIKLLSNDESDTVRDTALSYSKAVFAKDLYKMLSITAQFEKDRVAADKFVYELKAFFSKELRESVRNQSKAKYILKLIDITDSLVEPLKTNINLPLLFTSAAYRYYDQGENYDRSNFR